MKNLLIAFFAFWTVAAIAQAPQGLNYQAVARDADGQPWHDTTLNVQFTIRQDAPDGTPLYTETHTALTNAFGLFTLTIGQGATSDDFSAISWRDGLKFLEVTIDGQLSGTTQLWSVPYALFAEHTLDWVNAGDTTLYTLIGHVGIGTTSPIAPLEVVGQIVITDFPVNDQTHGSPTLDFQTRGLNGVPYLWSARTAAIGGGFGVTPNAYEIWEYPGTTPDCCRPRLKILPSSGEMMPPVPVTISSTGEMGIGTMNPEWPLDIHASIFGSPIIHTQNIIGRAIFGVNNNTDAGFVQLDGKNGRFLYIGARSVYSNTTQGTIRLYSPTDGPNAPSIELFINDNNQGTVSAAIKNFRMQHPTAPDKEIWYACIEGPEAAAYERGTAQLIQGEAIITFSEHFQAVSNPQTMTVQVVPLSADSKGLAVVEKTATGFKIKELFAGAGNYQLDWEVKCVRRGYEDYEVVREKRAPAPQIEGSRD